MAKKKSKKKQDRIFVTLECTEQKGRGASGMSRYTTKKNRKNTANKLELSKYNPFLRKHTIHREIK